MAVRAKELKDLANVGKATLGDFAVLGISRVEQLVGKDPVGMYVSLCEKTGQRHDPCVIDVFMAVVDEATTGKGRDWWDFTPERKRMVERPEVVRKLGVWKDPPGKKKAGGSRTRKAGT